MEGVGHMGAPLEVMWETLVLGTRFLPVLVVTMGLSVLLQSLGIADAAHYLLGRRRVTAVLAGAGVGAFSPLCSCTVVPVVRGLLRARLPLGGVVAFWIASPLMDPEIFLLTVAVLGVPIALARLIATGALSVAAGFAADWLDRRGWFGSRLLNADPVASCGDPGLPCSGSTPGASLAAGRDVGGAVAVAARSPAAQVPAQQRLRDRLRHLDARDFGREVARETWVVGRWLIVAFLLQVLIVRYVPQAALTGLLGTGSPAAIPLAAILGVPLYLTNVAALPIVAGLLEQGMEPGAAITFLIAGSVTTMPAMAAVRGTVNGRVFAFYLAVGILGAITMGFLGSLVL